MAVETAAISPTRWGECEIRGPVHLFRERLLLRLFQSMLVDGRILDAGCGSGSLALDLCRAGYQVDGVEFSEEFVGFVEERIGQLGLAERLKIKQSSVTQLDFEDGCFDGLICGEVLEHVTSEQGGDKKAVEEFFRVLKPGAPCVASVPLNPGLWDHSDEWARHVKRYTREGFVQLFDQCGFEVEKTRVWGFPLGRIYHRSLFAPWLRKTSGQEMDTREERLDTRAGRHPLLVKLVAGILRFDEFFSLWPWGRGIVLCARRRA